MTTEGETKVNKLFNLFGTGDTTNKISPIRCFHNLRTWKAAGSN